MRVDLMTNAVWLNKTRAAMLFTVMLLTAFLIISWTSFKVAQQSLEAEIKENTLPLTSDNVYSEIQQDLLRPIFISSLMAHDTFVRDWVLDNESDPQAMIRYLREIDNRFDTIFSFFISDKTKRYYDPQRILKTMSENVQEDQWYFQARELSDEHPYLIEVGHDPEKRDRLDIFINHKVKDYNGNVIGIAGVGMSVEKVKRLIEKYQERYRRTIYFMDKSGQVVLHGADFRNALNIHQQPELSALATAILTNPGGSYQYDNDGPVFLNTRLIPEFDWYLMIEQRSHPSEHRLWITLMKNLGVSLTASLLFLFLLWLTIGGYQRRLERMATTDKLTGVMNRQAFDYFFKRLRAMRFTHRKPMSILILDIDHFKRVNDAYGHGVGDLVLQNIAQLLLQAIRSSDQACRWGGEEFVVLLDDCSLENALQRADILRRAVEIAEVSYQKEKIHITISVGVTQYRENENLDTFINRADIALYRAKQLGRNRVESADNNAERHRRTPSL